MIRPVLAALATACGIAHPTPSAEPVSSDPSTPDEQKMHAPTGQGAPLVMSDTEWPAGLAYSGWQPEADRRLLVQNGVGLTPDALQRARTHPDELIRAAALALLATQDPAADGEVFKGPLTDGDPHVRAWAAYGSLRAQASADAGWAALHAIAAEEPDFGDDSPLLAAGLMARLGDPTGWSTLTAAFQSYDEPDAVVRQLFYFAPHHGHKLASGSTVDVWAFYDQALQRREPEVHDIALAQLAELRDPASAGLLKAYLQRATDSAHRRKAEAALAGL